MDSIDFSVESWAGLKFVTRMGERKADQGGNAFRQHVKDLRKFSTTMATGGAAGRGNEVQDDTGSAYLCTDIGACLTLLYS